MKLDNPLKKKVNKFTSLADQLGFLETSKKEGV